MTQKLEWRGVGKRSIEVFRRCRRR